MSAAPLHQGIELLVAEDNKINQKVITQQLKMLGYKATVCDDGVDALTAWEHSEFSLLLTDCNMPNMDGYELTRSIREREQASARRMHLPIVALTANAHVGEEQKCRDAGMDALLTKPTDLQKLDQVLAKYLDSGATTLEQAEQFATKRQVLLIDRGALKHALGDEPSLVAAVLVQFKAVAESLDQRLLDADDDMARAIVKHIQKAAGAICAQPLVTLCEAFPTAGSTTQPLKNLRALLNTTARQIRPL